MKRHKIKLGGRISKSFMIITKQEGKIGKSQMKKELAKTIGLFILTIVYLAAGIFIIIKITELIS